MQQKEIGCDCGSQTIRGSSYFTKRKILHFEECINCGLQSGHSKPITWKNLSKEQSNLQKMILEELM